MFTGGLKECEMTRIKLQGVCPTALAKLVNFIYTGNIRVTEVTVCSLLPAATMFQVKYKFQTMFFSLKKKIYIVVVTKINSSLNIYQFKHIVFLLLLCVLALTNSD